ncbi:MAG: translation initiation factor IF-2 [Bacilli bacterium]|nr:translation initiation factor IF-2 [Bacilli bacterium]
MKVKEILEILKVPEEELLTKLDNVGITANLETDITQDIIKKLSKVYKVDIKAPKAKKPAPMPKETPQKSEEKKIEPKKEKQEIKPEVKEEKKMEEKRIRPEPTPKKVTKTEETKKPEAKPAPRLSKPAKTEPQKPKPESKTKGHTKGQDEVSDLELKHVYDDKYNDYETEVKVYTRLKNVKKKQNLKGNRQSNYGRRDKAQENVLIFFPGMTVAQVADGLNVAVSEIIRKLITLGYMVNATQILDRDAVEVIADDYNYGVKDRIAEDITKFEEIIIEDNESNLQSRPPIVTIMGHVDHGKTTLLDTIRNSKVVADEAGGITQHIGAYQVNKDGKLITFIDTPGHAAFTEMRARGADVTDIVILVVAADDGVMPQTKEAIDHAKSAKVPIIVAINKIDKPQADPQRIKQELSALDLVPEEWGGKTIFVPVSALKGQGVDELLEMVILTSEMENLRANPNRLGVGTVIEARLDKGRGPIATLLVKNGSIKIGDPIVVGNTYGKIRAMTDETRAQLKTASPAKAVEITGLESVPFAGDSFMVFEDEKTSRLVAEERAQRAFDKEMGVGKPISLANLFDQMNSDNKELNLIIKGDVQGSIEAIKGSLEKLIVEGVIINVIRSSVGTVTETDVNLAVASNSVIIAFNVRPTGIVHDYAKEKNIEIRLYNIIYKVLEDIEAAMKGMLDPVFEEKVLGQAEIRTIFKASKIGTIAGCYVTTGAIVRNSDIRLIRDSIVIYEGKLSSLKRFKDDVREVKAGYECGMTIENYNDIKEGDIIEAYAMVKIK